MALPLIYAAGAIVARYIAKRGLQAAAKKYTKKAISEGKKHAKDMVTKPKVGNKVPPTKLQRQYRQGTRIALGIGAAGSGTVGVAKALSDKKKLEKQKKITAATSAKDKREANEKLGNQAKALQQKLAKERAAKRKANTETERAKSQTSIEKTLAKIALADEKLKTLKAQTKNAGPPKGRPKSSAPSKSLRPKMPSKPRPNK